MNDTETGFSIGSHEACSYDGRDLLDSSHFPDLEDNNRAIGNNDGEMDNFHEPLNNENANKVCENFKDWFIIFTQTRM